ncbi:MAG: hypothetical protein HWN71_05735 [Desulfobacterales bacterium]|nr:hypothetical protein [Desulfobacterales bacterium]
MVVSIGDTKMEVVAKCGERTLKEVTGFTMQGRFVGGSQPTYLTVLN